MLYLVLGMHKSGTTLVSQTLDKSGISMGEYDESIGYDQGNHYERPEVFAVNLELVHCAREAYFSLDHHRRVPGPLPDRVRKMMSDVVEREDGPDDWGIKEPLCCLTHHLWSEVLPRHRLIGIYRDPNEVMKHYRWRARTPHGAWKVLRAWSSYNRCVLAALRGASEPSILLRYDELMRGDDEFHRLQDFVGRPLTDLRRSSAYRASGTHPLLAPLNWISKQTLGSSPAETLGELDRLRAAQLG